VTTRSSNGAATAYSCSSRRSRRGSPPAIRLRLVHPTAGRCGRQLLFAWERCWTASYSDAVTRVWRYVFVDTENPGPKRVVREIRKLDGVVRADALLGTPDVIALVEGDDLAEMDSVIDRIAELPGVLDTESKVARWID
jgi:DNA-binding Lrp family transcriptional regulator